MDYNWLHPTADARPVGAKGWGSFATERIVAGTTVAAFGGWIVTRETLSTFSDDRQGPGQRAAPLVVGRDLRREDLHRTSCRCSHARVHLARLAQHIEAV